MSDKIAIAAVDGLLSYAQLDVASRSVATALLEGQADLDEARVAYFIPPSAAHVAVQRGIWRAGGVTVPLALSHPPPELEYVIRDADARTVVAAREHLPLLAPIVAAAGARLIAADEALTAAPLTDLPHLGSPRRAMP